MINGISYQHVLSYNPKLKGLSHYRATALFLREAFVCDELIFYGSTHQ